MYYCKTCNNSFNKADRHLECLKCRNKKHQQKNTKDRICKKCDKKYIGFINICSTCKSRHDRDIYLQKHKNRKELNFNESRRRSKVRNANFKNKFTNEIKQLYQQCPIGYQVDHIIPIVNNLICGLHVPWNLQILTKKENNKKLNKFDGTYENNSWRKLLC